MAMNRDAMRRVQQMQAQLAKAQADLQNTRIEGSAGGGAVKVILRGDLTVESLSIQPEVIDPHDAEMLQDLIVAAVNEALQQVNNLQTQQMSSLAGALGLGGARR